MTRRRRHLRTKRGTPRVMAFEIPSEPQLVRYSRVHTDPTDRILAESQPVHDTVKRILSSIECEHANEVVRQCLCASDCPCRGDACPRNADLERSAWIAEWNHK